MLSVRPKVAELAFRVFGRSLHPELFQIHKSHRIERDGYQARIDITSSGHVVTWCCGRAILTEVASSAQQPLPKQRQLLGCQLRGSRSEEVRCRGGIRHRTKFQLEPVPPETFWTFQETLFRDGTPDGLLHTFDSSGRIALGAVSYVHVETRLRSMRVRAVHTFPDDYAIVKIDSLFSADSPSF